MLTNFVSGFSKNAAIFTSSIFQRCKFESSRYGVSSTIQISSKFKFNPNPYLQPSQVQKDASKKNMDARKLASTETRNIDAMTDKAVPAGPVAK